MELKEKIKECFEPNVTVIGFSGVDRFTEAPGAHHPDQVCKNAKSVIVFGILVSQGMLRSPKYGLYAMHRLYHTVCEYQ